MLTAPQPMPSKRAKPVLKAGRGAARTPRVTMSGSEHQQPDSGSHGPLPVVGELLFGRYQVLRELGRGGMGLVLLAHDRELDIDIAVKLVPDLLVRDAEGLDELKREVLRGMTLTHPGVVRTNGFERDERMAAIVMEYVDGGHFSDLKRQQAGGCFDVEDLLPWLEQLGAVLDYAHFEIRIAHRDLKPRNLMYTLAGRLKVADFGISSTLNDSFTRVSMRLPSSGTPAYMSPQQVMGERPSHLDDVYAMGATIYELLTGKPPFYQGQILAQVFDCVPGPMNARRADLGVRDKARIPRAWEETVAACLAKRPADRPQSAGEVVERLRPAETIHLPARPAGVPDPLLGPVAAPVAAKPVRARRRHSSAGWAAAGLAAGGLAVVAFGALLLRERDGSPAGEAAATAQMERSAPRAITGPRALPPARAATGYLYPLTAAGLQPPLRWALEGGMLPPGLQLGEDGVIHGTPVSEGRVIVRVRVTGGDGDGTCAWRDLTVRPAIRPAAVEALRLSGPEVLPPAAVGVPYQCRFAAAGGVPPHVWSSAGGVLPAGMLLDSQGILTGVPREPGSATLVLTVTDAAGAGAAGRRRLVTGGVPRERVAEAGVAQRPAELPPELRCAKDKPFVNSLGMRFVPVGGHDLLIAVWLTRVADYRAFVEASGHDCTGGVYGWRKGGQGVPEPNNQADYSWQDPGFGFPPPPDHAVCGLSWDDAQAFCKWLTAHERDSGELPAGCGYRLPTDAEWQRALGLEPRKLRADLPGGYPWGDSWPPDPTACNLAGLEMRDGKGWNWPMIPGFRDFCPRTSPVDHFAANQLGIHDLFGNVWHYCGDPPDPERRQVRLRGGSWASSSKEELKLAHQRQRPADRRCVDAGFRCVIAPVTSP